MMARLANLARLAQDQRGTSMIEMALVAPFLATLIIGTVDLSLGYSSKLQLEQISQRAVEKAMQGMQGDDSTDIFETLQDETAAAADVPEQDVEVRYWLECNGVSQNTNPAQMAQDYEKVCPSGQRYSRHLSVKIEKGYTPFFKTHMLGANDDGTYTLVGESGIRVQ